MSCIDCSPEIQTIGADPAIVNWRVVRGDTSSLRVQFLENNEITNYDTSGWTFRSTAYDRAAGVAHELEVLVQPGYADITASAELTSEWGTAKTGLVAALDFDLEVTFEDNTIWTPVIGTIGVSADMTLYGGI